MKTENRIELSDNVVDCVSLEVYINIVQSIILMSALEAVSSEKETPER
jgi:hypothetical protein